MGILILDSHKIFQECNLGVKQDLTNYVIIPTSSNFNSVFSMV